MTLPAQTVASLRAFFQTGQTRDVQFRVRALKSLETAVGNFESELLSAVETDLDKAPYEVFMMELATVYNALRYTAKHLKKWSKVEQTTRRFMCGKTETEVGRSPFGVVLLVTSWSNPFSEILLPLISAVAAGNCVIIKPSQYAPTVNNVVERMLKTVFSPDHVLVAEGDRELVKAFVEARPDFIYFSGQSFNGRNIMRQASRFLIPLSLQLRGKSPCIVSPTADLELAARRIIWGKLLNVGQSSAAPDFVVAHDSVKSLLIEQMIRILRSTYGVDPSQNPEYQRICTVEGFERLRALMNHGRIMWGGRANHETLQIEPTIIDRVSWDSPVMRSEVFGPVLPILSYSDFSDILHRLNQAPHPLCFYVFSNDPFEIELVKQFATSGSCCINDTIVQSLRPDLPYGGVGLSGFGAGNGRYGYELFSYPKAVMTTLDRKYDAFRYPPYPQKMNKLRRCLRRTKL